MQASHISVVSVPVSDQEAAKNFYVDVLGFHVITDSTFGEGQPMRWVQLGLEGARTGIALVTWFPEMPAGSQRGMVLEVEDLEEAISHLTSNGVDVGEVESAPWGSWVTIKDPDGNQMVVQKSTPYAP